MAIVLPAMLANPVTSATCSTRFGGSYAAGVAEEPILRRRR